MAEAEQTNTDPLDQVNSITAGYGADEFVPLLSDDQRLQQLVDYLEEHVSAYDGEHTALPSNADLASQRAECNQKMARLPDSIVHASMLVLGAGVDHQLPYTAYADPQQRIDETTLAGVPATLCYPTPAAQIEETPKAVIVALHPGDGWNGNGVAWANVFTPECAALAQRAGVAVCDVDYPLLPETSVEESGQHVAKAIEALQQQFGQYSHVFLWASTGAAPVARATLVALAHQDSNYESALSGLILTNPRFEDTATLQPVASLEATNTHIPVFIQLGSADKVGTAPEDVAEAIAKTLTATAEDLETAEYLGTHVVAAPTVQRQRLSDIARFIRRQLNLSEELTEENPGEYNKEEIDRINRDSWRK